MFCSSLLRRGQDNGIDHMDDAVETLDIGGNDEGILPAYDQRLSGLLDL